LNGFAALMNIHYLGFKVEQLLMQHCIQIIRAIDYRVRNLVVVVGTTIVLWSVMHSCYQHREETLWQKMARPLNYRLAWTPRLRSVCNGKRFWLQRH